MAILIPYLPNAEIAEQDCKALIYSGIKRKMKRNWKKNLLEVNQWIFLLISLVISLMCQYREFAILEFFN
jgi:hypothetical protein